MHFRYSAYDQNLSRREGLAHARDAGDLAQRLGTQGLTLVHARRCRQREHPLSAAQQAEFCHQLQRLLVAGIPLIDALDDLAGAPEDRQCRQLAQHLACALRQGESLSQALRTTPAGLDSVSIGVIAAGEASGELPDMLLHLAQAQRHLAETREQRRQALLLPAITAVVTGLTALFLLTYLVPTLRDFLSAQSASLPLGTRLLFLLSDALTSLLPQLPWLFALLLIALLAVRHRFRRLDDPARWLYRLPLIGRIHQHLQLSRLCTLLGLLHRSGIPFLEALRLLETGVGPGSCRRALQAIGQAVEQGIPPSEAFARHPALFPPRLCHLLRLGERSGRLDQTLAHAGQLFRDTAEQAARRLNRLLEPAMTLLLGGLLGWMAVATLLPIYDSLSHGRF